MTPLEATDYLRRRVREDDDIKLMVTSAVTAGGHSDMFDWASANPEQVVMVAEAARDLEEQTAEFARRLATGDLS
jgi:hypothetical protein